jgi:putative hemolysin
VLWLLGQRGESEEKVTDEEIKMLVAEAEHHGTIESDERRMIAGVMRLGDRAVRAVMTPRTEVDWLNLEWNEEMAKKMLMETPHSRLPAGEGSVDSMIGVIQTRDVLAAMLAGKPFDPRGHVRPVPIVHDQSDALDVLTALKEAKVPVALVHDEYGHFEGIVTPADILEAITGVFRSDLDEGEPQAVQRDDGSWLIAGYMPADEMADLLDIDLPENRDYETIAGFLLSHFHHLPATGEVVDAAGWRFEVLDLDGRRIDKVLATRLPQKSTRRAH